MSGVFSPKTPKANKPTPVAGLQVQSSSYGLPIALRYGRNRCAGQLIDYTGFRSVEHAQKQKTGGKGGSKKTTQYSYTYNVTFLLALGEGGANLAVNKVWKEKSASTLAAAGFTLFQGTDTQTPWAYMQSKFPDRALAYVNTAYVAAADLDLGDSPSIANYNFDLSALYYVAGKPGAKPREIITDYLTNSTHGAGFNFLTPLAGTAFDNYCLARGIYLSPFEETQRPAGNFLKEMVDTCNSALVWTQSKLQIIPYGDEQIVGADGTYTPDLTPQYEITPDDYRTKNKDGSYVRVERKPLERAYNHIRLEVRDAARDYVTTIVEAKDQADIDTRGLRSKAVQKMEHITSPELGRDIAQMILQRELYVRRTFHFDLTVRHSLLDLMDLITITDPVCELDAVLARVISITEQNDGLGIEAEEVLANAASAPKYTTQNSEGFLPDFGVDPGNTEAPMLINAPAWLTDTGYELWIAAHSTNANWGGAQVWISTDDLSYTLAGIMPGPSRIGTLNAVTGAMGGNASTTIDTTNTVDVTIGRGALYGGTDADRDEFTTLSYLESDGGEFISFKTATLTSAMRYTLASLRRAAYGTTANSHAAATRFARLDDTIFRLPYDAKWDGKTVYVKLPSFNVYGQGQQALADATAYSIVLKPNTSDAPVREADLPNSGVNLLWDEWSRFNDADTFPVFGTSGTPTNRATTITPSYDGTVNIVAGGTGSMKLVVNDATGNVNSAWVYFGNHNNTYDVLLEGGKKYVFSMYLRTNLAAGIDVLMRVRGDNGSFYDGGTVNVPGGNVVVRREVVIDLTAFTGAGVVPLVYFNRQGSTIAYTVWVDALMIEEQVGKLATPSAFSAGPSSRKALRALQQAAYGKAAADGNIKLTRSATAPASGNAYGDVWIDSDAGDAIYRYIDGAWVAKPGDALALSMLQALGAQATADGKATTFYTDTESPTPTATGTGDLWYIRSKQLWKRWSGTAWDYTLGGAVGANLVQNPSGLHDYDGWTGWIGSARQRMTTRMESIGPVFACDYPDNTTSIDMGASQRINGIAAGGRYVLSATMFGFHRVTGSVITQARFYNSSDVDLGSQYWITLTADDANYWKRYEGSIVAPAGTSYAIVLIRASGTGVGSGSFNRWTQIKFESGLDGSANATPFSDDATPKQSPLDSYLDTSVGGVGRWRLGLRISGSGHRVGSQRNLNNSLVSAYGSIRTTTALSAASTGVISVNAHTVRYGSFSVTYNAVASAVTGGVQGTKYVVYCTDADLTGGTKTWSKGTSRDAVMNISDDIYIAGEILIPTSGTSSGGGGGGLNECVMADELVCVRDIGWIPARHVDGGHWILCWDDNVNNPGEEWVEVESNNLALELCGVVRTDYAEVRASDSTPMPTRDGGLTLLRDAVEAVNRTPRGIEWSPVREANLIGMQWVAHIRCKQRCYFAGADPAYTIATHNPTYKP